MTRINKMVCRGFKSFAMKTELVFNSEFNCVLGPNGSGKSNILDALCFVLGKGSAKGLRAEKSANLIYNGGKTNKPAKDGEISIYFDNINKTFPTEEKEVKLTRIVKQTGQSVYKINDKTRTRQQILDLLSVANINPDGYNIILQGDIVKFVEMSSVDRRRIVEEIAGVSVYEEKKNKALKEIGKVEDMLNNSQIILTERKTRLDELKSERNQALKYKDMNSKIGTSKASLLHIQLSEKNQQEKKAASQIQLHKDEIDKIHNEISKSQEFIIQKKETVKKLNEEVEEKGEKSQVKLHKEIEQLKVDIATNKTRISSCENEITRLTTRKDQLQKNLSEITEKIESLQKEKGSAKSNEESIRKEICDIGGRIDSFRKKHKLDDVGGIEKDIDQLDKEIEEKQRDAQSVREKQQELLREKDRIEFQVKSIDEKIEKVFEVEKEHKKEIMDLKNRKDRLKKVTVELTKILNDDSSLAAQLSNAQSKLHIAKEEQSKLSSKNTSIMEKISGNVAIQKILQNKDKFGGVFGTVSELGGVSSKYSQALEVAAGHRLKSIVVQDDVVGSKCIKYLKSNKLGTATFLPLNKIRPAPNNPLMQTVIKANGVCGAAIDLISFDPKFRNVFSYVFGNTLVVDNIDVARRIGIGKIKMVTLDGDLVEMSGAMHGGYRRRKEGLGFQQKELTSDLAGVESRIADLIRTVEILQKKKDENEDMIEKLRNEKAELEGEIIKTEKGLHLDSADLDANKKVKEELQTSLKEKETDLDQLINNISTVNKALAQLKIKKQEMRNKITILRNPTLVAELTTFDQKKEQLKEELTKVSSSQHSIDTQIINILQPEKDNIQKILKQHDREESGFKDEIEQLKEKIKSQQKMLLDSEEKEKVFYSKFKELFNRRNKLVEEVQKIELKINTKEGNIKAVEQRVNALLIDNARIKSETSALEEEFKQFKDVKIVKKPIAELKSEVQRFERMMQQMGAVNMKALEIYENVEKEYQELMKKKEKLLKEKDDVLEMMNEIETKKTEMFLRTYESVNLHFKSIFTQLSTKGEASLSLENPEEPFEDGLRIKVRITGHKFLDIKSLSGGEKTLTALAFIFAIQEFEPASFYILDEVDAALDKRNSEKLAKLIKKYSDKAQYIIISHNDGLIAEAETLYGVSMNEHGMSKVVSLKV